MRHWLRSAAAAGHPLLAGHGRYDRWIFTFSDADRLVREAQGGPWRADRYGRAIGGRVSAAPASASTSASLAVAEDVEAEAAHLARALVDGVPVKAGDLNASAVPRGPGLYAWWHAPVLLPRVIHRPSGATRTPDGALELAYVGIAGSLSSRLLRAHLGGQTGRSTLRRALGAWMGTAEGWRTEWRAGRVQHNIASEAALTTWMRRHLLVTWVEHPAPASVELAVISILSPPLNHRHNRDHPNWPGLDAARSSWRRGGEACVR